MLGKSEKLDSDQETMSSERVTKKFAKLRYVWVTLHRTIPQASFSH